MNVTPCYSCRTAFIGSMPLDPLSFVGGAVIFAAVALLASLFPARRAASVNVDVLPAE